MPALDHLLLELWSLRDRVKTLEAEMAELRGEADALRIMQIWWPPRRPRRGEVPRFH